MAQATVRSIIDHILNTARDLESATTQSMREGNMADLLAALNEADRVILAGRPAGTSDADWELLPKAVAHGNYVAEAVADWAGEGEMAFTVAGDRDRGELVDFDPGKPAQYWVDLEAAAKAGPPALSVGAGVSTWWYVGMAAAVGLGTLWLFGWKGKK